MIKPDILRVSNSIQRVRILCPTLYSASGHELTYTLGLCRALHALLLKTQIIVPDSSQLDWTKILDTKIDLQRIKLSKEQALTAQNLGIKSAPLTHLLNRFHTRKRNATLQKAILNTCEEDLTLVHTASFGDLLIIAEASEKMTGQLCLVLRYDHYDNPASKAALKIIASKPHIHLVTDSHDLAHMFEVETGRKFPVIPPPVKHYMAPQENHKKDINNKPVFAYFGGARPSKGFHKLPHLVSQIQAVFPDARFFIQAYLHADDTDQSLMNETVIQLKSNSNINVETGTISEADYNAHLRYSDVMMLPYDPDAYRAVTSGVFVEGVCAGKIVLVPDNSWMAAEAKRYNLSRVQTIDNLDFSFFRDIMQNIKMPCKTTSNWAENHSYDALSNLIYHITQPAIH